MDQRCLERQPQVLGLEGRRGLPRRRPELQDLVGALAAAGAGQAHARGLAVEERQQVDGAQEAVARGPVEQPEGGAEGLLLLCQATEGEQRHGSPLAPVDRAAPVDVQGPQRCAQLLVRGPASRTQEQPESCQKLGKIEAPVVVCVEGEEEVVPRHRALAPHDLGLGGHLRADDEHELLHGVEAGEAPEELQQQRGLGRADAEGVLAPAALGQLLLRGRAGGPRLGAEADARQRLLHPRVLQRLGAREPLALVHHEEAPHEVLRGLGEALPGGPLLVVGGVLDPAHRLLARLLAGGPEGAGTDEEHVQHHAQGPSVREDVGAPLRVDLWRRVRERADAVHRPRLLGGQLHRRAEVAELEHLAVPRAVLAQEQEVLRLHVPVHHAAGVEVARGEEHLPEEDPAEVLVQAAAARAHAVGDALVELPTAAEL
mmetsp:Transcript_42041/g.127352  ORF Transcript_42041/g.127352 Transcript_42041/m.127352 type:complete len:429 (+) Transcript_42041:441-1727(+)